MQAKKQVGALPRDQAQFVIKGSNNVFQVVRWSSPFALRKVLSAKPSLSLEKDSWGNGLLYYARSHEMRAVITEYQIHARTMSEKQRKETLPERIERARLLKQKEAEELVKKLPALTFEESVSDFLEEDETLQEPQKEDKLVEGNIPIAGFEKELLLREDQQLPIQTNFNLQEEEFPSLSAGTSASNYEKPNAENIKTLQHLNFETLPKKDHQSGNIQKEKEKKKEGEGKGKGKSSKKKKSNTLQSNPPLSKSREEEEEILNEYGYGVYIGGEGDWVQELEGDNFDYEEWEQAPNLDFEDGVSFVGNSQSSGVEVKSVESVDWDVVSESSQISFSNVDFDEIEVKSISDSIIEGEEVAKPEVAKENGEGEKMKVAPKWGGQVSFASALKQNLGEQKVMIRPPRLPPSTFVPKPEKNKKKDDEDDLDSMSPKDLDRTFGKENKSFHGKSEWKPPKASSKSNHRVF